MRLSLSIADAATRLGRLMTREEGEQSQACIANLRKRILTEGCIKLSQQPSDGHTSLGDHQLPGGVGENQAHPLQPAGSVVEQGNLFGVPGIIGSNHAAQPTAHATRPQR